MPLSFPINFGKWSRWMLLAQPARLLGGSIFEIQGFLAIFRLRAEKVIARCEEPLRSLQSFPISPNRFFEASIALETMVYI